MYNRFTDSEHVMRGLLGRRRTFVDVVRTGSLVTRATVRYRITGGDAIRGTDYAAPVSRVLTFDPGVRSVPIPITITQGTIGEASETIHFALRRSHRRHDARREIETGKPSKP